MDIGVDAIAFLIDTWEGHLTPKEVAHLADKASRSSDRKMVMAASELALSVLPHVHSLETQQIQRALVQCKEQSPGMLQQALATVETAAIHNGAHPEALYDVAKKWFELYAEAVGEPAGNNNNEPLEVVFSNNQPVPVRSGGGGSGSALATILQPQQYVYHLHNHHHRNPHHQHSFLVGPDMNGRYHPVRGIAKFSLAMDLLIDWLIYRLIDW